MADNPLTESYDFLQKAVGKFAELVVTLAEHLQDEEIAKVIMADLGLDPDSGAQLDVPAQNMASIEAYLESTDTDIDAFLAVVDDLLKVTEAIESFIELAGGDATAEDLLRELAFQLLLLSNLAHYRYRYPSALALGELLGLVDFGLEDFELTRLLFAKLGNIYFEFSEAVMASELALLGVRTSFRTEADARARSDGVLLVIGALLTALLDLKPKPTDWLDTELLYGWDIHEPGNPTFAEMISDRILSVNLSGKGKVGADRLFEAPTGPAVPGDDEHLGETDRDLDNRVLSAGLKTAFQQEESTLTSQAVAVVEKVGRRWRVVDSDTYTIKREGDSLRVYSQPVAVELTLELGIALVPEDDGGPGFILGLGGGGKMTLPLSTSWSLEFDGKTPTRAVIFLNMADISDSAVIGPPGAGLSLLFKKKDKYLQRRAKLPDVDGLTISFGGFSFGVELAAEKFELRAISTDNTLVISSKEADSFVRDSLPAEEIRADFGVGLAYDLIEQKVRFTDGTRLKVVLPLAKTILGVQLVYLTLEIAPTTEGDAARIEVSGSFLVKWGPFKSAIDRIGLEARLPPPQDETGAADWSKAIGFKPPTGIGFSIDSPGLTGGGFLFFDRDAQEYAGALHLAIADKFDLKVIAVITTVLPDGGDGFSMMAIGSIEFATGVNLIWGFTLEGVGLLVGVHRSMVLEVLRTGVRNGTLDQVLFPRDPVMNAPKIINDLRAVFPTTRDRHVFGALLLISWAGQKNSLKLKLGVVLEVPAPVILAILGQLELTLPTDKAGIVLIKADIVGIWDQAAKSISVDAALRDSKIGKFPMIGEMAVRGNWGPQRVFIVAVGGVHPAFNPPSALPSLRRVQIAVGTGDNPRLRLEGYLAVTSNTFQVGARAELYANKSGFTLEGWVGIDALFQFDPFKVEVDFSAGVEIRRGSRVLFSLTLKATLEAFTPIRIKGKVKFKIFFVSFSIPVNLTLGSPQDVVLAAVDVMEDLVTALNDVNNWAGELPRGRETVVTLRDAPSGDGLMVHPVASLSVRQQVVPLNLDIQVYRNARPSGDTRFEVTHAELNGKQIDTEDVKDFFAPAQFLEMSDDEKLASPSFEELPAGVTLGGDAFTHGGSVSSVLTYETILIDRQAGRLIRLADYPLTAEVFAAAAEFGSAGQSPTSTTGTGKHRAPGLGIEVSAPSFVVAGVDDLVAVEGFAGTYAQALAALRARLETHPGDLGRLQVVGLHEGLTT
jgi:hypothetical protein